MALRPDNFTEQAKQVLQDSQELTRRCQHSQWDVEHILLALLDKSFLDTSVVRRSGRRSWSPATASAIVVQSAEELL